MSNKLLTPLLVKNGKTLRKFEALYENYFPRTYAYVSYRVNHTQDVEDLVAEIFYKVVKAMIRFEWQGERAFGAWIFRITRNVISNFYRQQQRWDIPLSIEDLPELPAGTLLPEQIFLLKQTKDSLLTLMKTLPPRQQEVIALKYFGGIGNKEIALLLELEERTVAAYLSRGLKSLQQKCSDSQALEDWKIWMRCQNDQDSLVTCDTCIPCASPLNKLTSLEVQLKNLVPQIPTQFREQLKLNLIQELA